MTHLVPIPFLFVTVALLVRAEIREAREQIYAWKPISTLLVIAVALLSLLTPEARPAFTLAITLGLLFSLGGDLALMFESNKAFRLGLISFLLAHVVYVIAFTVPNGFQGQDLISGALLLVFALAIFLYLKPGLGPMGRPVLVYVLVICLMVNRAISTFYGDAFSATQAWLMTAGAVLFMVSDLMLAVNRFRHPFKLNRLSLLFYYGGQLLIAMSPSYF